MTAALEMINITKRFPGVLANDNVCLSVNRGEVHGILGENGAGKSTLMNILCGLLRPTSGEIFLDGEKVSFSSAKDAMSMGIGMVHQHFMLVPTFSVVENCLIGMKSEGICMGEQQAAEQIYALAEQYHFKIDPYQKVEALAVGERQRVEIVKALYRGARILILDEPSAVLTPQETEELFHMISSLTRQNYTVLFISHKLNEVKEICNRVTVLRQGKSEGTHDVSKCSIKELAKLMVGREVKFSVRRGISHQEKVVLDIQNLSLSRNDPNAPKLLDNICIQVKKGEVVGIAGVDGNGQSELVECLTGLRKIDSGTILFDGKDISNKSTRQIMSNGVSHIPEDRTHTGLILSMNLIENMILQDYYRTTFGTSLFINWKYAHHYTEELIKNFNIKTPGIFELVKNLSGGNQQAVIAAREITRNPKLLIAMHPTRGLDIGRIEFIHDLLMRQRDAGMAILLVSTELDEIRQLSDRILPIYEGKITGDLLADEASVEQLGLMMGGAC